MGVEAWFDKRTFKHQDFADIPKLIKLKEKQNVKISVCLPTLNSGKTLGHILRTIKILVNEYPLVDELAIVDSRSTDNTVGVALRNKAKVFFDDEYLPDIPRAFGKGEALWKSLYFLEGDIILWIDSDIKNIHPRFVYGPLGPLLKDKTIGYVKGFYERPIKTGTSTKQTGGGRVTELFARPFLNLFYPELSGIIQPLSGEYAGRREFLESVPFFTGYGVELGLLIDILNRFGLDSIAQVNLEKRIHINQNLPALGRMAFGVMQTAFMRLETNQKIKLKVEMNKIMNTVRHELEDDEYHLEGHEITVVERPPISGIKAYRKKFGERK